MLLEDRYRPRTFADSRYVALETGKLERMLADGLALQGAGNAEEARRLFAEAVELVPEAYMPQLLLGGVDADDARAIEALTRAETLNPRSCQASFRLGERLAAAGDRDAAAAAFHRARAAAPTFAAPQERLGELAEAAGRVREACQLYEEAALQNSAFALPVAKLAAVAVREGRIEKAVGLLERSLQHDPGLWLTNFLVGRVYVELKRYHQARLHLERALDGGHERAAILTELAKAEVGLGNLEKARAVLEESRKER
jgi:tetratricopeptide (TPR) repeat protein